MFGKRDLFPALTGRDRIDKCIWYHFYMEHKKWYQWTYLQNRHRKQTYGFERGNGDKLGV